MYYFLSTAHGLYPKGIKLLKDGSVEPEDFGKVQIYAKEQ
jgi:hypothetical protein